MFFGRSHPGDSSLALARFQPRGGDRDGFDNPRRLRSVLFAIFFPARPLCCTSLRPCSISRARPGSAGECAAAKASDLVVHEWGTFLGMSGSDGTALDGMYHEEHALPAFVHGRSRDQLRLPVMFLKGETPVIYFYTKEKQNVRVGVGFPRGIWTQWYPQAAWSSCRSRRPRPSSPASSEGGRICWFAEVIPRWAMPHHASNRAGAAAEIDNMLPETSSDALWNHAREVDAAFVKTIDGDPDHAGRRVREVPVLSRPGRCAAADARRGEPASGTLTLESGLEPGRVACATSSSCGSKMAAAPTLPPCAAARRNGQPA